MGLTVSLPLTVVLILMIRHYCRKVERLKKGIEELRRDLNTLFAERDSALEKLREQGPDNTDAGLKHEYVRLQENINFLTEFYNIRVREYNSFIKKKPAKMAINIIELKEAAKKWLRKK